MTLILLLALGAAASLPVVSPDTARIIAVSARVGIEIDAPERRAFHLFPGCTDFSAAFFSRLPDSTYSVEIRTTATPTGQRFSLSRERFRRIGRYIDDFERVVRELASLPDGESLYCDLWAGTSPVPERERASLRGAPAELQWSSRIVNCATGAACGLGIGGTVGAARAIQFVESRPESVLVKACMSPAAYWYHYSVDYYNLNRGTYAAWAGTGAAAGGTAGWLVGRARDRHRRANVSARRGLAGYDFFGDPIAETEVRRYLSTQNRVGWTLLGTTSGFVVGTGVGLILTSIARNVIFRPTQWDSIVVRNDGFSLDVPLVALSIAGILKGAQLGYLHGFQDDWRDALEDTRRERLTLRR